MKKSIKKFSLFSTLFIIVLGTILHFTYEWSNENPIIGVFSAINESTWEHLKLLFFPIIITTIIGYFYFKEIPNFLCGKVIEALISMFFVVNVYYTYTGVLGRDVAWVNILIFILAVIVGEIAHYVVINSNITCNKKVAVGVLVVLAILFILFTFKAPEIGLFEEPGDGNFYINNGTCFIR